MPVRVVWSSRKALLPKVLPSHMISKMKNGSFSCLSPQKATRGHASVHDPCCSGGHAGVCGPRTTSLALLGCHTPSKCPWSVFPRRPYGCPLSVPLLDAMLVSMIHVVNGGHIDVRGPWLPQRPCWYPWCVLPPETMLLFMLLVNAGRNVCPWPRLLAEAM